MNHDIFWNPCSRPKDFEQFPRLSIQAASGSWITLTQGHRLLDGIASWWCKSLGHGHPRLKHALEKQMARFEHVIGANTTHEIMEQFCAKLCAKMPGLSHVAFGSDGASSVEMALKMSLHTRKILGQTHKTRFLALQNGYHGETSGALSVSDLGRFKVPYTPMLFPSLMLKNIPYVNDLDDPLEKDCSDLWNTQILPQLLPIASFLTAIILEPLVQGAAGMKIYSADFLRRVAGFAKAHGIHVIADEIMTGVYRTGPFLACEHAGVFPDFVCLSKGLTSGWLPLSVMVTSPEIYQIFYEKSFEDTFLHSHTFSGNALAVALGLEVLTIFEEELWPCKIKHLEQDLKDQMDQLSIGCAGSGVQLKNIRALGAIAACEMDLGRAWTHQDTLRFSHHALREGLLLRPLGNTLYWAPPLNITPDEVKMLGAGTVRVLGKFMPD